MNTLDPMFKALAAWDRWDFLTVPLPDVLNKTGAYTRDTTIGTATLVHENGLWLRLDLPTSLAPLERDIVARGLLAARYGIDTTNWPTPLAITPEVAR